jgi:hypothetical protein
MNHNKAGNVPITLLDQDITFGFTDAQGTYQSNYSGFPNTISITARRDQLANSPLSLFFGSILGTSSMALTATARATIYSGDVTSLQVIPGVNAHILPVALDVNAWNTFYLTGQSPDGQIYTAANGYPQLKVYPSPGAAPGNFGLLDVGPPQNNVPAFRSWIDFGETPNDISYLITNNLLPVSLQSPKDWKCGPGLKSTLQEDFYSQLNVPNLLPLFQPVSLSPYQAASGNGQNATYAIVGFAGVKITQAEGRGSSMDISVQPAAVIDPTAVISHPAPTGTQTSQFGSTTTITTFISAKLTQ